MQDEILKAFQVLDGRATLKDVFEACRLLFTESDEFQLSRHPFAQSEVDAVARGIYEYILQPDTPSVREISFLVDRPLEGKAIEYSEYASRFSEDMLYQNCKADFASMHLEDLRRYLKVFLVGLLFRYAFCADEDRAVFRISKLLEYIDGFTVLLLGEGRSEGLLGAVVETLRAFRSIEPQLGRERLEQGGNPA